MLTRVILQRKYGCSPEVRTCSPNLPAMMEEADAALIIGDPALRINPASLPYQVLDLGREWTEMTGLPMIFALWSGPAKFIDGKYREAFATSCRYGIERLDDIVAVNVKERQLPPELIREYLTRHIVFELNTRDLKGLDLFWSYAEKLA